MSENMMIFLVSSITSGIVSGVLTYVFHKRNKKYWKERLEQEQWEYNKRVDELKKKYNSH